MILTILFSGLLLILMMAYYYAEYKSVKNIQNRVKLRIAVTGSRGKSTTVRFLCFVLKKAGYSVLGKVTGTKPLLILPSGETEMIKRKGIVSILEQKRVLLRRAKEIEPDALITEIMSVTPEYQMVESKRIIDPHYYIITNVKNDHIGETGPDKESILKVFINSAPENAKIMLLEEEKPLFESSTIQNDQIIFIDNKGLEGLLKKKKYQPGFDQTIRFTKQICDELRISHEVLQDAISDYQFDEDVFFIKKISENSIGVNAFSANDIDSTKEIFSQIERDYPSHKKIGIFCTRSDKPDRTKSWMNTLKEDCWNFDQLLIFGPHFFSIKRQKYPFPIQRLSENQLSGMIEGSENTVYFGFGNYVKSGEIIANFWMQKGGLR